MRKYFFSAMALVLGLFTVAALFATTFESQQPTHHYLDINVDPEQEWQDASNWEPTASGPPCDLVEERICRLPINTETANLQAFLNGLTYEQLLSYPFLEMRSNP